MNKTMKAVLGVSSAILLAIAAGLLVATIALTWLYATQRSADGFLTSPAASLASDGHAISSADIDLGSVPEEWLPSSVVGTFRVEAEANDDSDLFIGLGPTSEVTEYLADVEYTEVTDFGRDEPVSLVEHAGSSVPRPPESETFWFASSEGAGRQTLEWEPEMGEWTLVIMNSNAGAGVGASTSVGMATPWMPVAIAAIAVLTLLTAGVGIVLALLALRRTNTPAVDESVRTQPAGLPT